MNQTTDQDYQKFKELFFRLTGINLSLYKEEQMKRRLNTLRAKRGFPDFVACFYEMKRSEELLKEFLNRMTINVTEFFRNKTRWDILEKKIRRMAEKRGKLTIWSAACSTGEEPYSLAILLKRYLPDDRFQIIATDIDRNVLKQASEGRYLEKAVTPLSAEERRRYFSTDGLFYTVSEDLKQGVQFCYHNLLSDPAPGIFDLIVCRNVLIYFTDEGKKLIYRKLSDALKEKGVLFVGSTEQIFHPEDYHLHSTETFFYEKAEK